MTLDHTDTGDPRRSRPMIRIAITAVVALAILVVVSYACDARLAVYAESLPPEARDWGRFVSAFGLSGYMFALSGAVVVGALALRQARPAGRHAGALQLLAERGAYVFAVLATSGISAQIIKHLVGRARPAAFESFGPYHFALLSMKNSLASFPSGHSATAFGMAVALSMLMPRLRVALFTLAIGIALSRIVVEAHYVSDILAGASLGAVCALVVARLFSARGIAFVDRNGRPTLKGAGSISAAILHKREIAA